MTDQELNDHISKAKNSMEHAIDHLVHELSKLRTGKASTAMLADLMVEHYGMKMPLPQVATITTGDSRTLLIQPWDKTALRPIENAIFEANLGLTPQNDGETIRLNIPPLTEERRKELVKKSKALAEDTKIGIRNARRDCMEFIKKSIKDGLPEDIGKKKETEIQTLTDQFSEKVEKTIVLKEKDIMTV
jgi:ribosome recycling factor